MKIGTFLGISLTLNLFLLMLLIVGAFTGQLVNMLVALSIVFLHELGHIAMATLCGQRFIQIEFMPFGGVAKPDNIVTLSTTREILISISGPLVNLLIALMLICAAHFFPSIAGRLQYALETPLMMAFINSLPAMPLDGGRILSAALSYRLGAKRASIMVSVIGKIVAAALLCIMIYGIFNGVYNYTLILMVAFLFYGAFKEKRNVPYRVIRNVNNKRDHIERTGSMRIRTLAVNQRMSINETITLFTPNHYHIITVVDDRLNPVGCVSESQILDFLLTDHITSSLSDLISSHSNRLPK